MSGFGTEALLHWIGVGFYIVAAVLFAHAVIFGRPKRVRWGMLAAATGLVPHGVALLIRWQAKNSRSIFAKRSQISSSPPNWSA